MDTITIRSRRHGDRVFRRVGERQYQCRDGRKITLVIWQVACVACGDPFEVTAPNGASPQSGSFGTVHCPAHRRGRRRQRASTQSPPLGSAPRERQALAAGPHRAGRSPSRGSLGPCGISNALFSVTAVKRLPRP
jgi:hypothetical protein